MEASKKETDLIDLIARMEFSSDAQDSIDTINSLIAKARAIQSLTQAPKITKHPKIEFANRVLSILESQEDWDEGTIDDVASVAFELGLADTNNSTGLFKDLQTADPKVVE